MGEFFKSVVFFASSKMIHNAMNESLSIKYAKELIDHTFDYDKEYFLYIHIPFCSEFCTFCSFHKFKYEQKVAKEYFYNLMVELKKLKEKNVKFHTAYIGGGTPLIDEYELAKVIEFIKKEFDCKEISCETTPNNMQKSVLKNFEGLISRLSVGIQSFDDDILRKISRYNKYGSSKQLQEKIEDIKGIIPCTSIDLIFNFPNQTEDMIIKDLQIAKGLGVEQIVTYPLMTSKLKKATTFEHFKILKNSQEYKFYKTIREELKNYSMNNAWAFSKENVSLGDEYVVDNNEYIGVGSGAFTHINNQLFVNAYDLQQYKYMVNNHYNANIAMSDTFKLKHKVEYNFLLHLFKGEIDIKSFNSLMGVDILDFLKLEIFALKTISALKIQNDKIIPTLYGNFLSLIMMREFYAGMDGIRSSLRESMSVYENIIQDNIKIA